MSAAAITTIVISGVLILAVAFYLIRVALTLRAIRDTLGKILFGLRAIAHQTQPVNGLVTAIEEDTATIDKALSDLLASKTQQEAS